MIQIFDEMYVEENDFDENNSNILIIQSIGLGSCSSTGCLLIAYREDEEGIVKLPLIGKFKVLGLFVNKVASSVQNELMDYLY